MSHWSIHSAPGLESGSTGLLGLDGSLQGSGGIRLGRVDGAGMVKG